jgi:DNA helicase-2/ATP-dependent DNA helicase PcrA
MLTKTPYRVYGGLRFFDRAEIKNALAYLRLLANRHDDASFDRVVNTPTRGIGLKTIDELRQLANSQQISLWMAAQFLIEQKLLPNRAGNALFYFLDLIEQLAAKTAELPLGEKVQIVIENSGLMAFYGQDKVEKSAEKIENLKELVNAANLFKMDVNSDADISELSEFLSHAALESAESQANEFDDCVQLMTLHTAKGLEFRLVFLVGLEDGLFPSQQSIYDAGKLEEERRLCYVGITRAREKLYITHAEKRLLYGRETPASKSRFLRELPSELLEEVRPKREVSRPMTAKSSNFSITNLPKEMQSESSYRLGQRVEHESFGAGVILKMEGEGKTERALIKFSDDSRWLMTLYTKLHVI